MESLWDPGSQALLDELGLGSGSRCLEVGAGGGSMAEWMARRGAKVTAIDIDTRFILSLASDSIEVRRVDLRTDALPQDEFDLIHARLVLEHLSDRRQILDRLVGSLRRGSILIEDYDWTCFGFEGETPGFSDIADVILGFMAKAGFERDYGRRVVSDLEAAGLTEIRGEGRARLIDSTSPGFDFFRLSFESLRRAIVDAGLLSAEEADAASAGFSENVRLLTPMMMAGIGRRA
ncbi:MAG TPA: methyltransferase domain-containing protein [Mycobacterium sp.]